MKLFGGKSISETREHASGQMRANMAVGLDSPDLADHFAFANSLSARAAASTPIRKKIRERFRFERTQNSFLAGMVQSAANYVVGTGPNLRMNTTNKASNREIEGAWKLWCRHARFAEKLRTNVMSKIEGEAFGVMQFNPVLLEKTGIGLDYLPMESDQVEWEQGWRDVLDDGAGGIRYDSFDNPVRYPVLQDHPGDPRTSFRRVFDEPEWVDREFMCHLYRVDRPGQRRGVCEWLSALPLFALYRRMTLAVLGNIENSANMSGVLESDAEFDSDGNALNPFGSDDWFLSFPVVRRMLMTLPSGAKLKPWTAAQPSSQYDTFCRSLLREIARCTGQPYGIAAGDSSEYNYASVRKDDQGWHLMNRVERDALLLEVVERVFDRWLRIYLGKRSGIAPDDIDMSLYDRDWYWDGLEHVDPQREASAADTRLKNGTTTRGMEYAKSGRDVDDVDEQAADEYGFEGPDKVMQYRQWLRSNGQGGANPMNDQPDSNVDDRGKGPAKSQPRSRQQTRELVDA